MRKKEAGPEVYNKGYGKPDTNYRVPYTKSRYLPAWTYILEAGWITPEDHILDIGCGPGQFAELLHAKGFKNYIGLDFSSEAIKQATERVPDYEFVCENIYKYDFRHEFDVIVSLEVLEHLAKDLKLLSRFPKGVRYVFSVPNFDSKNHMRYFLTGSAVKSRYKKYCNIPEFKQIPGRKTNCLWLFSGTIRDEPLISPNNA